MSQRFLRCTSDLESVDLPDDVFEPGEEKPQRISKKKGNKQSKRENAANGDSAASKKRKLDDAQVSLA